MNWLPTSASTFAPQVDSILFLVTIISVVSISFGQLYVDLFRL